MLRKLLSLAASTSLTVTGLALPASANGCSLDGIEGNAGVLGSADNPYEIASKADLLDVVSCSGVASHFEITADIDLGGDESDVSSAWSPLASAATPFSGVIDGGGHVVSGLYLTGEGDFQGLFAAVVDTYVSDLNLVGVADVIGESVGLFAGSATGDFIAINVDVSGSVAADGVTGLLLGDWSEFVAGDKELLVAGSDIRGDLTSYYYVGGVVGSVMSSAGNTFEINNSRVDVSFSPFEDYPVSQLGGLVGYSSSAGGAISTSDVVVNFDISPLSGVSLSEDVGGLVGLNDESLAVHSVSVVGNIVDADVKAARVGGLIGRQNSADLGIASSSFSGVVQAYEYVGGLIGANTGFRLSNSITDVAITGASVFGEIIGREQVGGLIGHTGTLWKSTFLLQDSVNYADVSSSIFPGDPGYPDVPDLGSLGGLIGYSYGDINAKSAADAVDANRPEVTISRSANYGVVNAGGTLAGGLIGMLESVAATVLLEDSVNYGSVSALENVAGISGSLYMARSLYQVSPYPLPAQLTISRSFSAAPALATLDDGYAPKGAIGLITVDEDQGSPAEFVLTQNAGTNSVLWDGEVSGVSADAAFAASPAMSTEARDTNEMTRISDFVASGYDISEGWRGQVELVLNPPVAMGFSTMSVYTTWGICSEFNDGYPFLNDLYLEDVCGGAYVLSEPTIESLTTRWDDTLWASCDQFDSGRQFLTFAYESDPCVIESAPVSAAPYAGPVITEISQRTLSSCNATEVTISGSRLEGATLKVQGIAAEVTSFSDSSLTVVVPSGLTAQEGVDLVLATDFGTLRYQSAFDIVDDCAVVAGWTKKISDTDVKVYAKNVIGGGKVQFFVDGKEIAWINAADDSDSKLSFASSSAYFVRTVELSPGKNRFEIRVDGVRVWRATYVPKA